MYTLLGGTGAILPFLIAIFWGSKRKDYRNVAKLGLLPSFFNISEPIMFGMPVVMNPFFAVPFLFVPIINLAIAYPLTALGLVAKSVVIPPWTLPPILTAWVTHCRRLTCHLTIRIFIYFRYFLVFTIRYC